MSREAMVLDFFGLEKPNSSESRFEKFLHRPRSFRDIQGSISKIDPELLKTVIASGSVSQNHSQSGGNEDQISWASMKQSLSEISPDTAPLTIFYNGLVTVYDVPRDKAEGILKLAVGSADPKAESPSADRKNLLENLNSGADLPIFRKKSLQRFMEKRKERLTWTSPYACPL